jgi:hypothetical protein
MKPILAYVCKSRWCRMPLWIAIAVGLACGSPFIRQSLFGPRFGDVPWCVWEQELRIDAGDDYGPPEWWKKLLAWAEWHEPRRGLDWSRPDLAPLLCHLAEDRDARVRQIALLRLVTIPQLQHYQAHLRQPLRHHHDAESIAVLRRHLHDDDPQCRLYAACGLWMALKDREAQSTLTAVVKDHEVSLPREGIAALGEVTDIPELFDWFARWSDDPDWVIAIHSVRAMQHYGKRGVPVLKKGLLIRSVYATEAACQLGKDAAELMPVLLTLQNDPDPRIRLNVQRTLTKIDPRQFPDPANAKE